MAKAKEAQACIKTNTLLESDLPALFRNIFKNVYLSRQDIEAYPACDLSELDDSPLRGKVQALMQVLQTKAEE